MSRVAVVGAGTMGNGIAHVFAQAGWETTLIDVSRDALDKALKTIEANLERQAKKGAGSGERGGGAAVRARLRTRQAVGGAARPGLFVEGARRRPRVKVCLFRHLN